MNSRVFRPNEPINYRDALARVQSPQHQQAVHLFHAIKAAIVQEAKDARR